MESKHYFAFLLVLVGIGAFLAWYGLTTLVFLDTELYFILGAVILIALALGAGTGSTFVVGTIIGAIMTGFTGYYFRASILEQQAYFTAVFFVIFSVSFLVSNMIHENTKKAKDNERNRLQKILDGVNEKMNDN